MILRAPPSIERFLRQIEAHIVDLRVEEIFAVTSHGRVVVRRRGTRRGVNLTPAELRALKGTWVTHNHPREFSLSETDIRILYAYECRQVRAVARGANGDLVRYVAEPTALGAREGAADVFAEWLATTGKREGQFGPYQHGVMRRLARDGLVRYSKT